MKNKQILSFLLITVIISAVINYFIIKAGSVEKAGTPLMLAIMWTPCIATILTLLIFKQSIKTIRWRIGKVKYLAQAFYIPFIYISLAYLPLWLLGFFNTQKPLNVQSFIIPIVGAFINVIATFGEEVGWRGFLFPQFEKQMSFTKAALATGFIWSIWHIPGLLLTDYGNNAPWFTAIPFFVITLTAISLPMSYLCKKANSIWPAVLFHGAHNAFIQAFYDSYSVKNEISGFLIGETGIALVLTTLILAAFYVKKISRSDFSELKR